ncbi:DUF5107 domain-containing protein [Flavivirga abyssicola]|uniref:DUF5107 domain-containing protein n=1 Tax=Flavivirga abyssicola TaxID=3063533 RepID=UPI0026E0B2F1|nr:DUF5107 domain-containing protein [Flavivirga sp. MEBiC07777]WVK11648.1 DUF5107 domain-containing protein [Flavivirga sp. MEBiC07777]
MEVKVWSEKVVIPTYEIGKPEKNPIFLEKRVYQGSSGKMYPHPAIEKIHDEKIDKEWLACFLENDYLKIMILPELGGRVQMAYDKTKKRHFVYYNEVIKPALVGLTGPWISGGIEFNWPQHHRPSTYDPVDYKTESHPDGSKTVWCSEIERMFGTKGMAGFRLYPDKAYLEINAKLYNRTLLPQTFLWWANPAVAVNDDYQSVFPPDVNAVFDHGKRDVSKFPIATGTYYKFDYAPGTDISRYKNIPVPTSYMAIKSKYNFVGGYENDSKGGLLHVANHHVSPGKKQWTWGNGDFGKAWDRNLTDKNGPYIELMCGVYTDNQPDFSWIMPYEEKTFTQYFMPYQDLGVVKNASKNAMLNLEFEEDKALLSVYATGTYSNVTIKVLKDTKELLNEKFNFKPGVTYFKDLQIDQTIPLKNYYVSVVSEDGELLIDWIPEKNESDDIPEAAKAAKPPKEISTIEELFLNGQHLEQYRHATYNPMDYYQEALSRDPEDIRCNNAMGLLLFRNGKFAESEKHFLKGYQRQILRNPNPYDGEPLFNLGLSLRYQGKDEQAYEAFYKSIWNTNFMDSGYFQIAQIEAVNNEWHLSLDAINKSLIRNWHNHKARHLKTAILRKNSSAVEARKLIDESLELDAFNFGLYYEKFLLGDPTAKDDMVELMRGNIQNYIEVALDYSWAGMYSEAIELLEIGIGQQETKYPMALYYKAWFLEKSGKHHEALEGVKEAELCLPDYCFPNRLESVLALQFAIEVNPSGAKAPYYLGNFWYNARQYQDALQCWEKSVANNDYFPTVYRNLALAYYNKFNQPKKALKALETAFHLDKQDARILMELDQLYKKLNKSVDFRLSTLEAHLELVKQRDDVYIEWVYLNILNGDYLKAFNLIMERTFHPWEGGEGKITKAYTSCLVGLGKQAIENKDFTKAIDWLNKAKMYPLNLGEGKLQGAQENDIDFWLGCAYEGMRELNQAKMNWEQASAGLSEPAIAWFYNDQQPDTIFYQGMALLKLQQKEEAIKRFNKLIDFGKQHMEDEVKIDYFAVSLPDLLIWEDDLDQKNKIHCHYLMALGYKGKDMTKESLECFKNILEYDCTHIGVLEN